MAVSQPQVPTGAGEGSQAVKLRRTLTTRGLQMKCFAGGTCRGK